MAPTRTGNERRMRVLQINTGRARTGEEIRHHVDADNLDLALIQDPYTVRGAPASLGTGVTII